MKFPFGKYEEIPIERRNTLQVFITNVCNMRCDGCFARKVMADSSDQYIELAEYKKAIRTFLQRMGKQINILGGEPLLHPQLIEILDVNRKHKIKTTIYTNGTLLDKYTPTDFDNIKLRISIYSRAGKKGAYNIPDVGIPFDANFMISKNSTVDEMLDIANHVESFYKCKVFYISSIRELDNPRHEFFDDTPNTMPVIQYKELIHKFLFEYSGRVDIHISKRGVFESTKVLPDIRCRFANYLIGGRIIQCPYDLINLKYQPDYSFNERYCRQNSSCLMSKVIYRPI
jgi:MoaA/NifB/PqqE/SkfB family radical SAM enzyme